uniref:Ferrochelatase n=1 Tax=Steinernema glaseri TaxID=37863 RepID=A0A1I7YRQ0_9BILA
MTKAWVTFYDSQRPDPKPIDGGAASNAAVSRNSRRLEARETRRLQEPAETVCAARSIGRSPSPRKLVPMAIRRAPSALLRCGIRRFSSSEGDYGTSVLLLHHGQPRTPFYATQFLARSAALYSKLPESLTKFFTTPLFKTSSTANQCIADYGHEPSLDERLSQLDSLLGASLSRLLPEFGPINCSHAFLLDEPSIEQRLAEIIQTGVNRLVVLPLYPNYSCFQTGSLLNRVSRIVLEKTEPLESVVEGKKQVERIVPMADVSFEVSTIDRWSAHPVLPSFWSELIQPHLDEIDAILFVAPVMRGYDSNTYNSSIWSSCERVSEQLNNAVPWKLAFHSPWDHLSFPPLRNNIPIQMKHLRRNKLERVLVVPITHVVPSFDTQTTLPRLFAKQPKVSVLSPRPNDPLLVHGLAEVVKNHLLLGRRTTAQLSMVCKFCVDPECEQTRKLFSR